MNIINFSVEVLFSYNRCEHQLIDTSKNTLRNEPFHEQSFVAMFIVNLRLRLQKLAQGILMLIKQHKTD